MFCLVCGARIDDEAVSCPVCGSAVKISPPRPHDVKASIKQEDKKSEICPACGFLHDAGMMFCPRCGMRQSLYFKDRLNNEQTDIDGFEKHVTASGNIYDPIEQTEDSWDDKQDSYGRQFDKHPAPQSAGPIRDFEKYAAPQSAGPMWDFEKYAAPQTSGPIRDFEKYSDAESVRYDFEKHPEHAPARRRSFVGILVVAAVVIAAVAVAVYFFM